MVRVTVNPRPTCAVCGRTFEPDTDHAVVDVEDVRIADRNEENTFYLHARCKRAVFTGWEKP